MSKGIFIPDITVEMFRKAPLEAVETLLVEGEMHDVDMPKWIPCSERLPEEKQDVLLLMPQNMVVGFWEDVLSDGDKVWYANSGNGYFTDMCFIYEYDAPIAWMPLPTYEGVKK